VMAEEAAGEGPLAASCVSLLFRLSS
jgi:hypothetical protein